MSTELIHWFDKFHYFNVEIKSLFSLRNSPFFVKRGSRAEFNSQIQSSRFLLFLEKLAGLVWAENIVLCSAYNLSRVWMVLLLGFCQISLLCRDCGPAPHWHLTFRHSEKEIRISRCLCKSNLGGFTEYSANIAK